MVSAALIGQILDGKYSIERPLGKGGMGTVYLATHVGTGRPVAVKVIAPDYMERAEFVERFRREAQAAGRLRHPNVVDVTDFGFSSTKQGPDVAYLVMEYLDGCTLGEILDEEKRLPVGWSIDIIEQVCSAVQEAHRQGIIHRDLKPDNIWLEPNQRGGYTVKVLDFGIAKLEETELGLAKAEMEHGFAAPGGPQFTMVESAGSATIADLKTSTLVSENETIQIDRAGTQLKEEETPGNEEIVETQDNTKGVDTEGGTVIMDVPGHPLDTEINDKKTVVGHADADTDRESGSTPSTAALTRMGAVLGTPLYMSPEQCRGEKLTPRSDIYSLAVIVYQMFSGTMPFEGDYLKVMEGHKNEAPPPLKAKKVNKKLRRTVMDALSKDPERRPESAEIFANKLRANSEGLGSVLTRALVIFGERLPKLLLLAIITLSIPILLNFTRVVINFGIAARYFEDSSVLELISALITFVTFFLQFITIALLLGMTTWLVGQVLAYPLRPLDLRAAFLEARTHLRSLSGTVTVSSLIALIGYVFVIVPGIWLAARFMLIAPAVMMEGVRGRAAFRRSVELYKRAAWTIFATAGIIFIVSSILPISIGLSLGSIVGNIEKSRQIQRMKLEGVKPAATPAPSKSNEGKDKSEKSGWNFSWGSKGFKVGDEDTGEDRNLRIESSIIEAAFELIWTPIHLVLISFSTVLAALIYFKTRQAGGESMQELLGKLNSANSPRSKWQQRVNQRLVASGRISRGSGTTT